MRSQHMEHMSVCGQLCQSKQRQQCGASASPWLSVCTTCTMPCQKSHRQNIPLTLKKYWKRLVVIIWYDIFYMLLNLKVGIVIGQSSQIYLLLISMCADFEYPLIISWAKAGSATNRRGVHTAVIVEWINEVRVFRHFHWTWSLVSPVRWL